MTVDVERGGQRGDGQQVAPGIGYLIDQLARGFDLVRQLMLLGQPFLAEAFRVGFEAQVALDDLHALACVAAAVNIH